MPYSPSCNGCKRQRLQQQHVLVSQPARKRAAECHVHPQAAAAQPPSAQQDTHRWATFVSRHGNIWTAVEEASQGALSGFGPESGPEPTLAMLFCSSSYAIEFDRVVPTLRTRFPSLRHIVGCTGSGVIGNSAEGPQEIEGEPGLSLTLGYLPGVEVQALHITRRDLPDADASPEQWQTLMGTPIDTPKQNNFIMLCDPSFSQVPDLISGLDYAFPEAAKLGGFISAATQSAKRALFCWNAAGRGAQDADDEQADGIVQVGTIQGLVLVERQGGCVVVVMHGLVTIEPLIAQGCRALSEESVWLVQGCSGNIISAVSAPDGQGRMTPLRALHADLLALSQEEREQAGNNLVVATAPDDLLRAGAQPEDSWMIRMLMGIDPNTGCVAVGDTVHLGQRIRFMVRDAQGARQDLDNQGLAYKRRELQASMTGQPRPSPFGALVFTCNGRGRHLYGEPHWDSRRLADFVPVPSSGFFCNGEIAQVTKQTAVHGFTCAVGILRPVLPLD
eukprot:jgi/Astpho2/8257/fgenesh1_pg.00122_%23_30_t